MDNMSCAACGKGGDGLKTCTACKAVKYCNVTCQKTHRPNHKKECKKRAAELFDEVLFKQPPPREDCPICFLRLPTPSQTVYLECCGKIICEGCEYAHYRATSNEKCPFCRELMPTREEETIETLKARADANDADSSCQLGYHYLSGTKGLLRDSNKAMELFFQAVELGSKDAHVNLANVYLRGYGVKKDTKKAKYHLELAAIAGNEGSRYHLGHLEHDNGNTDRAIKHWMIAATAGDDNSISTMEKVYEAGRVTKNCYEKTLHAYKYSVEEMKSDDRDKAAQAALARKPKGTL